MCPYVPSRLLPRKNEIFLWKTARIQEVSNAKRAHRANIPASSQMTEAKMSGKAKRPWFSKLAHQPKNIQKRWFLIELYFVIFLTQVMRWWMLNDSFGWLSTEKCCLADKTNLFSFDMESKQDRNGKLTTGNSKILSVGKFFAHTQLQSRSCFWYDKLCRPSPSLAGGSLNTQSYSSLGTRAQVSRTFTRRWCSWNTKRICSKGTWAASILIAKKTISLHLRAPDSQVWLMYAKYAKVALRSLPGLRFFVSPAKQESRSTAELDLVVPLGKGAHSRS